MTTQETLTRAPISLHQAIAPITPGAVDRTRRTVAVVASSELVDRAGDRILADGWDLSAYRRNPVVLFAHRDRDPPIGRAIDISVSNGRLTAVLQFADAATYPFADQVFRLLADGYLNAVSVGFRPLAWSRTTDPTRKGGKDISQQELLEISVVPVPCLPDARVVGRGVSSLSRLALARAIGRGVARAIQALKQGGRHDERHPAGSPGGVGGQFAPGPGGGGGGGRVVPLQARPQLPTASAQPPAHRRKHGPFGSGNPGLTYKPLPETGSVNWSFIHRWENPGNEGPHIPEGGGNGVTVGPGVNLRWVESKDIKDLPKTLRDKISPWLERSTDRDPNLAEELARNPPALSNQEMTQLAETIMKRDYGVLARAFAIQTGGKSFADLPEPLQTVAMSVAWQHGPYSVIKPTHALHREFWAAVKQNNPVAAARALQSRKYDRHRTRRNGEISYLNTINRR